MAPQFPVCDLPFHCYVYMHNLVMKSDLSLRVEARLAAKKARDLGVSQMEIAAAIGASQSQVSRILCGTSRRRSRLFDDVCKYVFFVESKRRKYSLSGELTEALADVWDGTHGHAKALALVIRSLGGLGRHAESTAGSLASRTET